jgi:UDP-glucose 4-epimerase
MPAGRGGDPAGHFDANVRATETIGQWALRRGLPVAYLSGAIVYADPHAVGIDESAPVGDSGFGGAYGRSKLEAEHALSTFVDEGLTLAVVRATSIYGPGQAHSKFVPGLLTRAMADETIELVPPTTDRIDLIYSDDVAAALVEAVQRGVVGTFNVGSGPVTVAEVAETCVRVAAAGRLRILEAEKPRAPITRFDVVTTAARRAFGFEPQVSLEEGVRAVWTSLQQ